MCPLLWSRFERKPGQAEVDVDERDAFWVAGFAEANISPEPAGPALLPPIGQSGILISRTTLHVPIGQFPDIGQTPPY
jgi:hypothetical protein